MSVDVGFRIVREWGGKWLCEGLGGLGGFLGKWGIGRINR